MANFPRAPFSVGVIVPQMQAVTMFRPRALNVHVGAASFPLRQRLEKRIVMDEEERKTETKAWLEISGNGNALFVHAEVSQRLCELGYLYAEGIERGKAQNGALDCELKGIHAPWKKLA